MAYNLILPPPHAGQLAAWRGRGRFTALRCGRRWGKTQLAESIAVQTAAQGFPVGIFAPDYKILSETYRDLESALAPVISDSNRTDGIIRLITGGRVDFWTLNNPRAGRSRKYRTVIIDEAAFTDADMSGLWQKAIAPTLLDYKGDAWAMSTPNGVDEGNWFYRLCTDKGLGWTEYHAPTGDNPTLDPEEIDKLRDLYPPLVYRQEYLAEFVDWSGEAFFSQDSLLEDGKAAVVPRLDQVFAVIDTALKDGREHDGTAVVLCGKQIIGGPKLYILDWDVLQIEGASLETWLPSVFRALDELAKRYQARQGSLGAWIEDRGSGTVLLQQARKHGAAAWPIPETLVSLGKEGRALDVSTYVYRGLVKVAPEALDKVKSYRGVTRNHLLSQVCGFRIGKKTPHEMDLLDTFTYACAIALGNNRGY